MFFTVIFVTHSKSYIETTDFGGKSSKWRRGRVLSWKIPEFCSVGGARSQNSIFSRFYGYPSTILRTAYRKQFYPKPMVPMESWDSEGMPFASLASLWSGILADIGPWTMPKNGHVTITKVANLHISIRRRIRWFQKCYFSIYDEKNNDTKDTK